ncbi:MAG TPA: oligosaccharide flippase family protein [Chloroflexota bacterium]|nr:oligosaccharide flippase family protein [Chloroflexota bacterium]
MIAEAPPANRRPSAFYRGVFYTGSGTAISIGLLLVETLVAVRLLSPASYGFYVLLVVLANIGVVAIDFGCKTSATQMIAAAPPDRQATLAHTALVFRLAATLVLFFLVWLGRSALVWLNPPRELAHYIIYVPLLIAAASFDELLTALLQGFQRYRQMATAQIVRSILRVICSLSFLWVFVLGVDGLLYSWILSFAVSISYQFVVLPVSKRFRFDRVALGELLRFGLPIQGTRLLWFIFGKIDVLLLGTLAGTANVAFYSVAARIPDALQRFSESYTAVYFPTVTALLNGGKRREGAGIFGYSLRMISFAAALAALVAVVFSQQIVVILFSTKYVASGTAFGLLMIGLHMTLVTNIMSYTLTAAGYSGRSLAQDFTRSALNVVGDLVLIPIMGFVGPPLATILAAYGTNPLTVWLLRKSDVPVAVAPYLKQTSLLVGFSAGYVLFQPAGILPKLAIVALFVASSALLSTITLEDLSLVLPNGLLHAPGQRQETPPMTTQLLSTPSATPPVKLRYQTPIALLVTAVAAALRLYHVSANSYNLDEVWSIWMAGQSPLDLVRAILIQHWDNTPPVFYLFLQLFMQFGQSPFFVRVVSVVAGTATVWLTYKLAEKLFGGRVALLSAFLVAIAPLHIEFSQTARAYVLADFWALLSLYFCVSIIFGRPTRWHWLGLVVASVLALYTFYVTVLIVASENVLFLAFWLFRRVDRSLIRAWIASQTALAIAVLSTALSAFLAVAVVESGLGISWLIRPGVLALVKTVILFTTGDPSSGPSAVTPARALSLGLAGGLALLLVWVAVQRGYYRRIGVEGYKVLSVAAVVLLCWSATFVASQLRPVYSEKYILFLLPLLLILFAWAIVQSPIRLVTLVATVALVGLTGKSLLVYYGGPQGEQWREAVAYLRPAIQASDVVVIAPGFYMRPYAYYRYGSFPSDTRTVARSPAVLVKDSRFVPEKTTTDAEQALAAASDSGQRIWYVSGFAAPDAKLNAWIEEHYQPADTGQFLGARVELLQPTRTMASGTRRSDDGR